MSATLTHGEPTPLQANGLPLDAERQALLQWFLNDALPTWFGHGIDWAHGGFFERLTDQGQAHEEPRRTRVVARQIYVFCAGHRLGWHGQALEAVRHGLHFLLTRLRQPDGLFASSVQTDGALVDARFDLYEQAFALFALAHAHAACPDLQAELGHQAEATLDALYARYKHPIAGFQESAPPSLPLKANPHMHMLEATLAWEAAHTSGSRWHGLSDELAELALGRLIDARTGALYELFDQDWNPMPGDAGLIVEPGHQFEWAWLLMRWGHSRRRPEALRAAARLIAVGAEHGICPRRQVAINQLDDHFAVVDDQAKLWPQTEWAKAYHALSLCADTSQARAVALDGTRRAVSALQRYLHHPRAGLWQELMTAEGGFRPELCRASSFYHVVCAIDTLLSDTP